MLLKLSRRTFIGKSSLAALSLPALNGAETNSFSNNRDAFADLDLKKIVAASIDSAMVNGAIYADVRLTHTKGFSIPDSSDSESLEIGVRALKNGYWGFASSPVWSVDEAVRLGKEAVRQAVAISAGHSRDSKVGFTSQISDDAWTMPIKYDPFSMNRNELRDYLVSLALFAQEYGDEKFRVPGPKTQTWGASFWKQEKAFGSSVGQYFNQTTYKTSARLELVLGGYSRAVPGLTNAGLGFEHIKDKDIKEAIMKRFHIMDYERGLPIVPIDVGRHPLIMDSATASDFVGQTVGNATEIDRIMGYEANSGGTSYINFDETSLGEYPLAGPNVSIFADRTQPGALATVRWDDEGSTSKEFIIVDSGKLINLQTSRESSTWLNGNPDESLILGESSGCLCASNGAMYPTIGSANLNMKTAEDLASVEDMLSDMGTGVLMEEGNLDMDFQIATGYGTGFLWDIKKGKKVSRIANGAILFRTPELWKSIERIGGKDTVESMGKVSHKEQPVQAHYYTVNAPALQMKDVAFIDILRKA